MKRNVVLLLAGTLAADLHFVPVGLAGADGSTRALAPETCLAAGDRLTVVLSQTDLQPLLLREAVGTTPAA